MIRYNHSNYHFLIRIALTFILMFQPTLVTFAYAQEISEASASSTPEPTPEPTPELNINSEPPPSPTPELSPTDVASVSSVINDTTNTGSNHQPDSDPTPEPAPDSSPVETEPSPPPASSSAASTDTLTTGEAISVADSTQVVNLNAVNSPVTVVTFNITPNQLTDLNLNDIWQQLQSAINLGPDILTTFLTTHNYLSLTIYLESSAVTGGNIQNSDYEAILITGNAIAAANLITLANVNLINSSLMIGVVNIMPDSQANIIFPRLDDFLTSTTNTTLANLNLDQSSTSTISAQINANTGQNLQLSPDNQLSTGDALALINSLSLTNLSFFNVDSLSLIINNAGGWQGQLLGFNTDINHNLAGTYQIYTGLSSQPNTNPDSYILVDTTSQSEVFSHVAVTADTGNNQVSSSVGSTISTGQATAIANIFTGINLNFINSHFFIGFANILGNWFGNIIFAYPDVGIHFDNTPTQALPGDTLVYTLTYTNSGYDQTQSTTISLDLPKEVRYLSDTSGTLPTVSGQHLTWQLDSLAINETKSFQVIVEINDHIDFENPTVSVNKPFSLIPQAYAADNSPSLPIILAATIDTPDPNLTPHSKTATATTYIYEPYQPLTLASSNSDSSNDDDHRQPELSLTAVHNVNEFVHSGDTVSFELKLTNHSSVPAYNTSITQELVDENNQVSQTVTFYVGTIEPNKSGTLKFGLRLANGTNLKAGNYTTIAQALASAPDDTEVSSNTAATKFTVKNPLSLVKVVGATENTYSPSVLGQIENSPLTPNKDSLIIAYLLVFLISLQYLLKNTKITNPAAGMLFSFAFFAFLFSVYQIASLNSLIPPIAVIDDNYQLIAGKLRQFL